MSRLPMADIHFLQQKDLLLVGIESIVFGSGKKIEAGSTGPGTMVDEVTEMVPTRSNTN